MLLKMLFWALIACDVAALGVLFLLGLAAAPSSHTSPWAVAAFMLLVPGLLLAAAIMLFVVARSKVWRSIGLLIAATPLLVVVFSQSYLGQTMRRHQDANGNVTQFAAGPMQDLELAVGRNDVAAIRKLAATADLAQTGLGGSDILVFALRTLQASPDLPEVLRALLQAGANPDGVGAERPLAVAIQVSQKAGIEPVQLLLEAGADPNQRAQFGEPVWFGATGIGVDHSVLPVLLDRGADVNAKSADGKVALLQATLAQNWPAALLLLKRGADWHRVRALDGRDYRAMLEDNARVYGDQPGMMDVQKFLEQTEAPPADN
ncbi:MAG: hypothetical protein IPK97_21275 [Ahniella sp.]|nr:hypothetical protein [Ahniella sp.]